MGDLRTVEGWGPARARAGFRAPDGLLGVEGEASRSGSIQRNASTPVSARNALAGLVEARATVSGAACPGCRCWSRRTHGSHLRFPRDLRTAGKRVVVSLRVRRFLCVEESACAGEARDAKVLVVDLAAPLVQWFASGAIGRV
ncbi:transposase family protein [Streptomyces sp. NPDC096097]|uniref:transposase family protein n=1 Tax=Streptomyces sp. NPDC096097 TaxID=3155546 RepID=UPI003333390F